MVSLAKAPSALREHARTSETDFDGALARASIVNAFTLPRSVDILPTNARLHALERSLIPFVVQGVGTQAFRDHLEQRSMKFALCGELRRVRGEKLEDLPVIRHVTPTLTEWKKRAGAVCQN